MILSTLCCYSLTNLPFNDIVNLLKALFRVAFTESIKPELKLNKAQEHHLVTMSEGFLLVLMQDSQPLCCLSCIKIDKPNGLSAV